MGTTPAPRTVLEIIGPVRHALAVVAHPDDESFGLGAILAALGAGGVEVDLLCFTRGEASTLGIADDLAETRRHELEKAAEQLGVHHVELLDHADGALGVAGEGSLDASLEHALDALNSVDLLVMFEPDGVTGHGDHRAATAAALRAAAGRHLATLEWGLDPAVAATLRTEFGVPFSALEGPGVLRITVERATQRAAMACHASQAIDNPVLLRRLELQGAHERVRYRPGA